MEQSVPGLGQPLVTSLDYYPGRPEIQQVRYPTVDGQPFAVQYNYDTVGNLTAVVDAGSQTQYWGMVESDEGMRVKREAFGDGLETNYSYYTISDVNCGFYTCMPGMLRDMTIGLTTAPLERVAFRYDTMGNVGERTSILGASHSFQYDKVGRLQTNFRLDENGVTQLDYAYGLVGDLRFVTTTDAASGTTTEEYTPVTGKYHQIATAGTRNFEYDGAGRQIVRGGDGLVDQTLHYNDFGMPWKISAGSTDTLLEYDATESRVAKRTPTATTIYAGDLYECVSHMPPGSQPLTCAEQRYKVYAGGRLVTQIVRDGSGQPLATRYVHDDHLGSSTILTDENGQVQEHRQFGAFGDTSTDFTNTSVRSGFTGHEQDPELGLINMKGRLYDPKLRSFITPDPFVTDPFNPQGLNRYSYVQNNPATFVDPSGFAEECGPGCNLQTDTIRGYAPNYGGYQNAQAQQSQEQRFEGGIPSDWQGPPNLEGGGSGPPGATGAEQTAVAQGYYGAIVNPNMCPVTPNVPGTAYPSGANAGQQSTRSPGWTAAHIVGAFIPFVGSSVTIADPKSTDAEKGAALVWYVLDAIITGATAGAGMVVKGGVRGVREGVGAARGAAAAAEIAEEALRVRPDVVLSGGRSGELAKTLVGPPSSIVRGGGARAFVTDAEGRVVLDITANRVKPVVPGEGFGPKRAPTQQELGWLAKVLGGE